MNPSEPTRVVELVGSPGTGKSTLVRELLAADPARHERVRLRGWRAGPRAILHLGPLAVPFLAQIPRMNGRRWNRLALMLQLALGREELVRRTVRGTRLAIFDQGPVYVLSILQRALRTSGENSVLFEDYWERTVTEWASRLDLIVQLDAHEDVLRRRILARGTPHPILGMTRHEARAFFDRSRKSRGSILQQLACGERGPRLIILRTDRTGPEEAASHILDHLRLRPAEAERHPPC